MAWRRRAWSLVLATALLACAGGSRWQQPVPAAPGVDATVLLRDASWLADEVREGRGLGSAGLAAAAQYLADGFRSAGFEPGAPDGSFLQRFEMPVGIDVVRAELAVEGTEFRRGEDFEALLSSGNAELEGGIVFVGYGISDERSGFDEYAEVEVDGRTVLVLDSRPRSEGLDLGRGGARTYQSRAYKLLNARRHGAAAVLLAPSSAEAEGLPGGAGAEAANPTVNDAGVAALAVSRDTAEAILRAAGSEPLAALQRRIQESGRPASRALAARSTLAVEVARSTGEVSNVIARLPGSDPELRREAVVVGAHYDHLGEGAFGSLSPERRGFVHHGADDNASGSAGLLALARAFGQAPRPRRTLILAAFTAEEAGLVGSARYRDDPPVPIQDTVAMINLDMIGRLRDGALTVFGAESSPRFRSLVEQAAAGLALEVAFELGANGPSDQTTFYNAGVPVLFPFTGLHPEYHTPDDRAELLNPEGTATVVRLTYRLARALLDSPDRPTLIASTAGGPREGRGEGYGPYLGTVPAFGGPPVRGVRLQGVRPGSPAERAGLRSGDVIVGFDGAPVESLEEYAAMLFGSEPGEVVEIVLERESRRLTTQATLGQRR